MKNYIYLLLLLIITACQSTKIKNERYEIASKTPELGSIGQSKLFGFQNNFEVRTLPKLENNIRVGIEIIPFNKKLNQFYKAKAKFNQNQSKLVYIDSLPTKPELATVKLLDITGFIKELNADYNSNVSRMLLDTEHSKIVTSIAINFSAEDLVKIRQADTYYLTNTQEAKYTISLYKLGKKTDFLTLIPEHIVGYQYSQFCWATSGNSKWYIADITEGCANCNGNTKAKISKKQKTKNLFDM
jgi:hypothetical protein